jgi:hypothetical protein
MAITFSFAHLTTLHGALFKMWLSEALNSSIAYELIILLFTSLPIGILEKVLSLSV